jgi:GAF domain-containing protein
LSSAIKIPISQGIVGRTAVSGEIVNIPDAYEDPRFDSSIDIKTGFRTRSILAVPIYNNRGEIAGVTEMINAKNDRGFDDLDIRLMIGFNVFCGIALDNAKLYSASLDLGRQVRNFVDMSANFGERRTIRASLEKILENGCGIVSAKRARIFLLNRSGQLVRLISYGDMFWGGDGFARLVEADGEPLVLCDAEIHGNRNLKASHAAENMKSRALVALQPDEKPRGNSDEETHESLCCLPLKNSEGKCVGVLEFYCERIIESADVKLLDSVAIFAAVAIERCQLQDLVELSEEEREMQQYLQEPERLATDIVPEQLRLSASEKENVFSIAFDSVAWEGIGHVKVVFAIFEKFGLLSTYGIPNERFFRFVTEIRDTYKVVPYHNWRHAVDVLQFVAYELLVAKFDTVLTNFELLALCVACLCHDANHDGFTNVYNVRAETPLGMLFKNHSVMEMHHCAVSIGVLAKAECNIFAGFGPEESKSLWVLIIGLILATDMAKHFDLLKKLTELKDKDEFDMENTEHRLLAMQLILKCGDISNVSRPFELADKWCDVLCEEFFRQGDLESAAGMEYTSPLNDRAHLDKPKSQIGFYSFVCLPLFQAVARICPELEVNVEQVKGNLAVWKLAIERQLLLDTGT